MFHFQTLVRTDSLLASPLRTRLISSLMWQPGETTDTSTGSPAASALETVVRKSICWEVEKLWIWQKHEVLRFLYYQYMVSLFITIVQIFVMSSDLFTHLERKLRKWLLLIVKLFIRVKSASCDVFIYL